MFKCRKGMSDCDLADGCITVCMDAYGGNRKRIMIVGEAPGEEEDREGRPFVGMSGRFLRNVFEGFGLDVDRDCVLTNACRCRPVKNEKPNARQISACRKRLFEDIKIYKPKVLILAGDTACESYFGKGGVGVLRGYVIPERERWVVPVYHPARILRERNWDLYIEQLFVNDLERGLKKWYKEPVVYGKKDVKIRHVESVDKLKQVIDRILKRAKVFVFDFETRGVKPFVEGAEILCVGFMSDIDDYVYWVDGRMGGVFEVLKKVWSSEKLVKVAHNIKYEMGWIVGCVGGELRKPYDDTMLMSYTIDERRETNGLKWLAKVNFGVVDYDSSVIDNLWKEKFEEISVDGLREYNAMDVFFTYKLWKKYKKVLEKEKKLKGVYDMLIDSVEMLCRSELQGCRVSMKVREKLEKKYERRVVELRREIFSIEEVKRYGRLQNLNSAKQIGEFLFGFLKMKPVGVTEKGNVSVGEEVLKKYAEEGLEFAKKLLEHRKLEKLLSTYIRSDEYKNVGKDGRIHSSYWLHGTVTGRLSSSEPNLQNIPRKDMCEVRKMFLPLRKGEVLLSCDYSQWEVRVLQMYARDENLGKVIREGLDMHAEYAEKLFDVNREDKNFKEFRQMAKGGFVFATMYGAGANTVCKSFWEKYLSRRFKRFDEGVEFVRELQEEFFTKFKGIRAWHDKLRREYAERGYIETLFGRRRRAPIGATELINTPVQSAASDFTLLSAVKVYKELGLVPVLLIHDDLTYSVPEKEWYDWFLEIEKRMTGWDKEFEFVNVPIEVEGKVGYNWYNMIEVKELEEEVK